MEQNKRLTHARCNGIKTGYWSMARKDELVQRLGQYEDICSDPAELFASLKAYHDTVKILVHALRNTLNAPEDEDNMEKLRALVSAYDKTCRAKAQKPSSEPSSAI